MFNFFKKKTAATSSPRPFGPYYLQELINSGGMADIWLASDGDGKSVAVRRLLDSLRSDGTARKRFIQGCEILSKIHSHEYVIGYIEHGKIDGVHYCTMEYVEGSNLKLLFARSDEVLEEFVGNILIDMACALEHVHDSGYMHLDYKPENILITRNGSVRLVDFDLSMPKPDKPQKAQKNPGTPAYMAPEQLQRQPFDQRVDIFAYGVTAYELLTGHKPFGAESPDEILRKQLAGTPRAPREHNPDIPPALEKIILKCLEKDPAERYPNMNIVVRDLQNTLYVKNEQA